MQQLCYDARHDLPGQHWHCPACGAVVVAMLPRPEEDYIDHAWHCRGRP